MARKRMIDPGIWQDEGMAALTPRQQLLYIGLFSNADDEGRLKGGAAGLRLMLPTLYAGVKDHQIEDDVNAVLAQMRQLTRYEVDGRQYLAFKNYRHWQSINRPSDSHLPSPTDATEYEPSRTAHGAFSEESESTQSRARAEVKLVEEKGIEESEGELREDNVRALRATPLSDSFGLTPEMREWARQRAPDVNVDLHTERFENYWHGNGHRKRDWLATWKNWMLSEQDKAKQRPRIVTQGELNSGKARKFVGA